MQTARALACEFVGTAALLATVVGSGILAHKLDAGNVAVSVLTVAVATGCVLNALILSLGSISCQLNPVVTFASAIRREMHWRAVLPFCLAQIGGAIAGTMLANLMFGLPLFTWGTEVRTGAGQWLGEFIATFGLLGVIFGCGRARPAAVPAAVACYITGAICFTSSTCFANPAVTIARIFTDTLCGIRAADVMPFIFSQAVGGAAALAFFGWLFSDKDSQGESPIADELSRELARADLSRVYERSST